MLSGSIARRYAKALFALAVEANAVEKWAEGARALHAAIASSPELREALASPVVTREERLGLASRLAQALQFDAGPASLLALLAERNRLGHLARVAEHFGQLADEKLGNIRARVTSAVPLTEAEAQAVARRLAPAAAGKVIVERAVDPAILGGVVAAVGSLVYDGSLRSQLEDLRRTLKR